MGQSSLREPTGGFTTRTFVPLSRPRVPLGTKFMLSYGLGPHYFLPKFSTQPGKSRKQGSFIPKEFCWKLHRGLHVLDALTNTSVSGVGTTTQFPNAYKPQNSLLEIQGPKQHLLPARALPTAPLPSEALPFPVKTKSLAAYLSGYPEKLCNYILSSFLHCFSLHYCGPLDNSL